MLRRRPGFRTPIRLSAGRGSLPLRDRISILIGRGPRFSTKRRAANPGVVPALSAQRGRPHGQIDAPVKVITIHKKPSPKLGQKEDAERQKKKTGDESAQMGEPPDEADQLE